MECRLLQLIIAAAILWSDVSSLLDEDTHVIKRSAQSRIASRKDLVIRKGFCDREKQRLKTEFASKQNSEESRSQYSAECDYVDNFSVRNMTSEEIFWWVSASEGEAKSLEMLTDERTGLTADGLKILLHNMTNVLKVEPQMKYDKRFSNALALFGEAYFKRQGGMKNMRVQDATEFGSLFTKLLPTKSYNSLSNELFDEILEQFNNQTDLYFSKLAEKYAAVGNKSETMETFDHSGSLIDLILTDPSKMKAICKSAAKRFRRLDTLSVDDLNKLRYLLQCLYPRECRNVPNSWVHNNIGAISQMPLFCQRKEDNSDMTKTLSTLFPTAGVCGRYLAEKALTGSNSVTLATVEDLKSIRYLLNCAPRSLLKEALNTAGCPLANAAASLNMMLPEIKKYTMRNCIQMPENISAMTCSDLQSSYSMVLSEMKMSFYNRIPKAALCEHQCISMFKNIENVPQKLKKKLAKKCFSDRNKVMDSAAVDELGSMVTDLPPEKFKEINAADLERNIFRIKDAMKAKSRSRNRRRKQAVLKELAKKMLKAGKLSAIRDSKEIMKEMSNKELKSSMTNITVDLGLENFSNELALTDSQNKWVMQQLKKQKRPSNYTVKDIRDKKSLVKGFLRSDIKEMANTQHGSEDPQSLEMAKALCEQSDFPLGPLDTINRDLIVGGLNAINDTMPFSFLTTLDVEGLGCQCLMQFKGTELSSMQPEVCSNVCSKIGSCDRFRCMLPKHRRDVQQACMGCMNFTSNSLTEADLDVLGSNLLSEFTQQEMEARVSADVLTTKIFELEGMCMNKNMRAAVSGILNTKFGSDGSAIDEATLRMLGSAIMYFPQEIQQQMEKAVIASIASDIMESINPTDDSKVELKKCCEQWLQPDDKTNLKQLRRNLMLTIKDAVIWKIQNARRKRTTVIWTCSDIKLVGEAFTTVTDEEINNIAADEFTECMTEIGQLTLWTDSQKKLLLQKAVNSFNVSVCNMSEEELDQLGTLLLALSNEDLACLPLSKSDLVSTLGGLTGWNTTKLSTLAETYMSTNSIGDLSNISVSDIAVLGELICGFQPANISTIPVNVVSGSGIQLGRLEDCSVNQYTSLKNIVINQDAYGSVQNWSAADVAELNNLLVGVSSQEIKDLSTNAIEGLTGEVVSKLPGTVLAAMTTDQFGALISTQVALVTDEQKNHLSSAQKNLLANIAQGNYDTTDNTGDNTPSKAGTVVSTLVWLLTVTVMLVLLEP